MLICYICCYDVWQHRILRHGYSGLHYRTESTWLVPGTELP